MGQQTGPTDINLAGWDTPYTVNLPNGTTQAGVFHTTHAPTQDEINQFIADTEARLNMAATDQAKAAAKAAIAQQAQDIPEGIYGLNRLMQYQSMWTVAMFSGKQNQAAYLQPLLAWCGQIAAAACAAEAAIDAAATLDQVNAVALDVVGLAGADPKIDMATALGISN